MRQALLEIDEQDEDLYEIPCTNREIPSTNRCVVKKNLRRTVYVSH
jgi:hypothetical protein